MVDGGGGRNWNRQFGHTTKKQKQQTTLNPTAKRAYNQTRHTKTQGGKGVGAGRR